MYYMCMPLPNPTLFDILFGLSARSDYSNRCDANFIISSWILYSIVQCKTLKSNNLKNEAELTLQYKFCNRNLACYYPKKWKINSWLISIAKYPWFSSERENFMKNVKTLHWCIWVLQLFCHTLKSVFARSSSYRWEICLSL